MLGLAGGLVAHGHEIRFCAQALFEEAVGSQGFEFFALGGADPREVWADELQRRPKTRLGRVWRILNRPGPSPERLAEYLGACVPMDAMVCGTSLGLIGRSVAERLGIPYALAHLYPAHPTRAYANPSTPQPPWSGPLLNLASHMLARQMFWAADRAALNRWRAEIGLPAMTVWDPITSWLRYDTPTVFGFSPAVVPKPSDWPECCSVTGYWWAGKSLDPAPPAALQDFLASGSAPVSVGFGSIIDPSDTLSRIVLEAVAAVSRRAVFVRGWGNFESALPDSVQVVDSVSYSWLFPRACVAVHAGGAGTTAEAIRAGIPSVAVPFGGDQNFWARRLADLGVAPPPIPRARLTAANLAAAIERAATDTEMQERARRLARQLAVEDGPAAAAAFLSRYFTSRRDAEAGKLLAESGSATRPAI